MCFSTIYFAAKFAAHWILLFGTATLFDNSPPLPPRPATFMGSTKVDVEVVLVHAISHHISQHLTSHAY